MVPENKILETNNSVDAKTSTNSNPPKTEEIKKNKKEIDSNKTTKEVKQIIVDKPRDLIKVKDETTEIATINHPEEKKYNNYDSSTFKPVDQSSLNTFSVFGLFILFIAVLLLLAFSIFTVYNTTSETIASGIYIDGVDVSGLTKTSAISTINTYISENSSDELKLKHNDFESSISLEQISATFDVEKAVNEAYLCTREQNVFENTLQAIFYMFSHKDIELDFSYDHEQLSKNLSDMSATLPDTVIESSYYIEDNTLIVTPGKTGNIVDVENMENYIVSRISDLNFRDKSLDLITISKDPAPIDIEAIYNEIHKDPVDAYFTQDPYALYPSENGIDFGITLEEAKELLKTGESEYQIPLKILYPNVTTNMLGNEAFPNVLSTYSTKYATSNTNRTTNLILASNKINGTVLMPGESFSYNKVVGERTIAAGYKEAAIYVSGETVDGVGGGICQVATTLYDAALYANLEIVERSNHQFVPSYAPAGWDATVYYGSIDFVFKNNRDYPIKINCSVGGGYVNFQILGLATENDYQVTISASITSRTADYINSVTYKTLTQNGQTISSEIISRDTYKRH